MQDHTKQQPKHGTPQELRMVADISSEPANSWQRGSSYRILDRNIPFLSLIGHMISTMLAQSVSGAPIIQHNVACIVFSTDN